MTFNLQWIKFESQGQYPHVLKNDGSKEEVPEQPNILIE